MINLEDYLLDDWRKTMDLSDLWEQGQDIKEYLAHINTFQKEMKNRLRDVWITPSECQRLRDFHEIRKIFVLSDPGCRDCLMNIPILIKLVECAPNLEYKIFIRSQFPDFTAFLNKLNLDRIPIFYVVDENFKFVNHWKERPKAAQKYINQWEMSHPDYEKLKISQIEKGSPEFDKLEDLKAQLTDEMWNWYDTGLQSETVKEVLATLI